MTSKLAKKKSHDSAKELNGSGNDPEKKQGMAGRVEWSGERINVKRAFFFINHLKSMLTTGFCLIIVFQKD